MVSAAAVVSIAALASACGSAGTQPGTTTSTSTKTSANAHRGKKTIGIIMPFSGQDAGFGLALESGCLAAVDTINANGGVLGNNLSCTPVDSKGDPADGVAAVTKVLATDSNLVGFDGPGTASATAVMPIIEPAKIPAFGENGDVSFDKSKYKYYWRLVPSDDADAVASAVAGYNAGYRKAALFFDNSPTAQTSVGPILKTWKKLGGTVVANVSVQPDQPSYQTEAAQIAAAKPQVIFTETDPQTAATFFGDLKQLGTLPPIIGNGATLIPQWYKAVKGAIGASALQSDYSAVEQYVPSTGPAVSTWDKLVLGISLSNPKQYQPSPFSEAAYDETIVMALAMIEADSTKGSVYNNYIEDVTQPSGKSTVVHSFAAAVAAMKNGEKIRYEGAVGTIKFDKYHNSQGEFALVGFKSNGRPTNPKSIISSAQVAAAS